MLKIAALSSDMTYNSLDVFDLLVGEAMLNEKQRSEKYFRNQWFHTFRLTWSSRFDEPATRVSVLWKRHIYLTPFPD